METKNKNGNKMETKYFVHIMETKYFVHIMETKYFSSDKKLQNDWRTLSQSVALSVSRS